MTFCEACYCDQYLVICDHDPPHTNLPETRELLWRGRSKPPQFLEDNFNVFYEYGHDEVTDVLETTSNSFLSTTPPSTSEYTEG